MYFWYVRNRQGHALFPMGGGKNSRKNIISLHWQCAPCVGTDSLYILIETLPKSGTRSVLWSIVCSPDVSLRIEHPSHFHILVFRQGPNLYPLSSSFLILSLYRFTVFAKLGTRAYE